MDNTNIYNIPIHKVLAMTVFAEALKSGKGLDENDAIGILNVIKNRTNKPKRFNESVYDVILDPNQFSGVGSDEWNKAFSHNFKDDNEKQIFKRALQLTNGVMSGKIKDNTNGADHYYNPKLASPDWGKLTSEDMVDTGNMYYQPTYETKGHKYFKETLKRNKSKQKQTISEDGLYKVEKGDTLSSIGKKFGVSYLKLADFNNITNPNEIKVGQVLKLK